MSISSRGRIEGEADLADWSASSDRGRAPSPPRRERRSRPTPAEPSAAPCLQPADGERVAALLAELTRGTCQISFLSAGFMLGTADP